MTHSGIPYCNLGHVFFSQGALTGWTVCGGAIEVLSWNRRVVFSTRALNGLKYKSGIKKTRWKTNLDNESTQ